MSERNFKFWARDVYPNFWKKKSKEYGIDSYCQGLIKICEELHPKSCFELAIGTGYPFAQAFDAKGISISGCDVAQVLLDDVKQNCPSAKVCQGGYEDLYKVSNVFGKNCFDLVYCFRSTWYFENIEEAIGFMLFFAKPGGWVVFDIMNFDCVWNKEYVRKKNMRFPATLFKNTIKSVINFFSPGRYLLDTVFGVREIMHKHDEITSILHSKNVQFRFLNLLDVIKKGGGEDIEAISPEQKILYVVRC